MTGRFTYKNYTLSAAAVVPAAVLKLFIETDKEWSIAFITALIVVAVFGLIVQRIPCSYRADESGMSIRVGLVTRRFDYREIRRVHVQEHDVQTGGRQSRTKSKTVLSITTSDEYYEFCADVT